MYNISPAGKCAIYYIARLPEYASVCIVYVCIVYVCIESVYIVFVGHHCAALQNSASSPQITQIYVLIRTCATIINHMATQLCRVVPAREVNEPLSSHDISISTPKRVPYVLEKIIEADWSRVTMIKACDLRLC